jgi:hypothetical protein
MQRHATFIVGDITAFVARPVAVDGGCVVPVGQRQFQGALAIPPGSTSTITGPDITNTTGAQGLKVVIVSTAIGTGSITVAIQNKDRASGAHQTLLSSAAIVTNTTVVLTVFPGAPTTANVSANAPVGECWRLVATANNSNPATYSVGWSGLS